ncbi:MAG: chromosome segregation protein SMC [Cyclobacteriaceae bacterium]
MSEDSNTNNELAPKTDSKRIIIIISILSVLAAAILILLIQKHNLEEEQEAVEQALNGAYLQLDSISNELDERILTISQLGGEIDTLLSIKEILEADKRDLMNREKRKDQTIEALRDRVAGYQELLLLKDEEINQLTEISKQLLSENSNLKVEAQELNQSIRDIAEEKSELANKIALVSKLKVEGMKVIAVNSSGREREGEFRNRHINQLKIEFAVSENEVAPIEGKELLVQITAPDGNVLFDVTRGSGTFMYNGREMFYSAKKEILYDRRRQAITVFYEKGSEYAIGQYSVEIFTDSYSMGKTSFIVKN